MNRQTRKTQAAVEQTFLTLLQQKSPDKMTVSEIIEGADISRSTFYLHYQDIYDLYEKTENRLFEGLLDALTKTFQKEGFTDLSQFATLMMDYIHEHKQMFLIFMHSKPGGSNLNKVRSFFQQKILDYLPTTPRQKANILFIVSGIVGVIEEWLQGHISFTRQELSELLEETLEKLI